MFKGKSILLTLAVLALAATLIMPNVTSVLDPNPAETASTESLSTPADSLTWTTTQVVSTASTDTSYGPSLDVGPDGTIHIAWYDDTDYGGSGTDSDIFYKKWVAGTGWTTTEVVSTESTGWSYHPSLGVGPDGTTHIAWEDTTNYAGSGIDLDIFYKKYVPGTGWTTTEVVSTESTSSSYNPSLAVGSDGTVHVAWVDLTDYGGAGTDLDIFYKKWVAGTGWTTTEVVSTESTGDSENPSLAVGSDGAIQVAWEDYTDYGGSGSDWDIFYKKWVPLLGWTTTEVVSTESTGWSYHPSLGVGPDGTTHVAWEDYTDYGGSGSDWDIFYKKWVPLLGWTTTEVVSTESTSHSFSPSLAVGPDGTTHVAWGDYTDYGGAGTDLDIFYKKWVAGTGWTTTEVVSTESTGGSYWPSLDVGPDGTVHIAWHEYTDYGGSGTDQDVFYKRGERANVYLVVRGWDDRIYYRTFSDDVWGGWRVVPSGSTCDSPAAAVYGGRLYMVVRGLDGKGLWYGWVDLADDSFSGWTGLSGSTPSKPTLTRWGDILVLVVRGENDRVYYRTYVTTLDTWYDWIQVPTGTTCDSPAATMDPALSLHLVVRGKTGGLYLQQFTLLWPVYPGWTLISGDTPSAPTLTNNHRYIGDDNLLFLAVRGMNDGIYLRSWDGSWSAWSSLPGATIDAIGATVQPPRPRPDARIHLVVRGMTGGLYHGVYDLNFGTFLGWTLIGGDTPSPPTLTS